MMILPVLLASFYTLFQCAAYARGLEVSVDYLAFFTGCAGLASAGDTYCICPGNVPYKSQQQPSGHSGPGNLVVWRCFCRTKYRPGHRDFGLHLVLRFNSTGGRQTFLDHFSQLTANRIVYFLLAMILLVLTVIVYSEKRKGRWDFRGKIRSYRKRKSEA